MGRFYIFIQMTVEEETESVIEGKGFKSLTAIV